MKYKILFSLVATFLFIACEEKNEDVTHELNKNGSIETSVSVEHINDSNDVLVTKHIVWKNNAEFKTINNRDTIPALGIENTEAENEDGDTKNISVKKDYEIFITVK